MIARIGFLIGECWRNIRRQGLMAFACVSTSAIALTTLGAFVVLAWQVNTIAETVTRGFEVHAFLTTSAQRDDAEALVKRVQAMPGVIRARLVPKEVAWSEYRKHYPHQQDLEGMTDNPLPDKLEIVAATPTQTLAIAESVRGLPHVARVNEGRDVLRRLLAIAGIIRLIGLALAVALGLGTAAIIGNTIRMTLYARRRDIRVMQLVGATNRFIRLPFFMEGAVVGAAGGGVAAGVMAAAMHYLSTRVLTDLPLVSEIRLTLEPSLVCPALVAVGALLGAAGSLASLRRFLRAE
jgi:cell division transport system permease protein